MASFSDLYGGVGLSAVLRAQAAGLSVPDIQRMGYDQRFFFGDTAQQYLQDQQRAQMLSGFQNQIRDMQAAYQKELKQQGEKFAAAQRKQQQRMKQMQQQALEAQTRQAAPQREAQVLGAGKAMVIRPGASTRFSRPELQIKSMNI